MGQTKEPMTEDIPFEPGNVVSGLQPDKGEYVSLGSTNRATDSKEIEQLRHMAPNTSFDEQPCSEIRSKAIDFRVASD